LSIEFRNAELPRVAEALEKAIEGKIEWWRPDAAVAPFPQYSISMKDKSFWDIFETLSGQHDLSVSDLDPLRIMETKSALHGGTQVGCLMVFPLPFHDGQTLACSVVIDPRIRLVRFAPLRMREVIDDHENVLYKNAEVRPPWWDATTLVLRRSGGSAPLTPSAANPGKEIASAKGVASFIYKIGQQTVRVSDPEQIVGQPIHVAGKTVAFTKFQVQSNRIEYEANVQNELSFGKSTLPEIPGDPHDAAREVDLRLIDGKGRVVMQGGVGIPHSWSASQPSVSDAVGPFTLELDGYVATKEANVDFEIKHVPLP
jgi:hypothetical protein